MDAELITCPNPLCGKQIPSYSNKCKYCDTRIIRGDKGEDRDDLSIHTANPVIPASIPSSIPYAKKFSLPKLEPTRIKGVIQGDVLLTPKSVITLTGMSIFSPHASFKVNLGSIKERIYAGNYDLGVYASELFFPDKCPVTLMEIEKQEIFEVKVFKRSIGKVDFKAKFDLRNRIVTALSCDRYWFVVGFSSGHGLKDKFIAFEPGKESFGKISTRILFRNRIYAEEFTRLNQLENGNWHSFTHNLISFIGLLVFFIGLGTLILILFAENLEGSNFTSDASIKMIVAIISCAGALSAYFGYKGEKL